MACLLRQESGAAAGWVLPQHRRASVLNSRGFGFAARQKRIRDCPPTPGVVPRFLTAGRAGPGGVRLSPGVRAGWHPWRRCRVAERATRRLDPRLQAPTAQQRHRAERQVRAVGNRRNADQQRAAGSTAHNPLELSAAQQSPERHAGYSSPCRRWQRAIRPWWRSRRFSFNGQADAAWVSQRTQDRWLSGPILNAWRRRLATQGATPVPAGCGWRKAELTRTGQALGCS